MSLKEKLKAKRCPEKIIEADGDQFLVIGLSRLQRSVVMAQVRGPDGRTTDPDKLEKLFLCECVRDPETRERVIEAIDINEWDDVPASIVARLVAAIADVNQLDEEDRGVEKK